MEILIICALILTNGIFAMSELAVVSARRARLETLADRGDTSAAIALQLAKSPTRFLATVQIGITSIGILAGAFGGSTIANSIAQSIRDNHPTLSQYADALGVAVVVGLTTYASLVIGELVPKRIALQYPEQIARRIGAPMLALSRIATPLVLILSASTSIIIRLIGLRPSKDDGVSDAEVLSMIRHGVSTGAFDRQEANMVRGVLELDDHPISSIITPRTDIVYFDLDDTEAEIQQKIIENTFTTYPVVQGDMDNVLGIVRTKDLLVQMFNTEHVNLKEILLRPLFIPESVPTSDVLKQFKNSHIHTALIIGEHGGVEGLVRMHDIVEKIFGNRVVSEFQQFDPEIIQRADGSWLVDGQITTDRLADLFPDLKLPAVEQGQYETLGGFILVRMGRVPTVADHFMWGDHYFEVVDMDGVRIDKVLIRIPGSNTEHYSAAR